MIQLSHIWSYIQRNEISICKDSHCKDSHSLIIVAAPFTIAKIYNQTRDSSTDEWIKSGIF
jgi:hypothetical protein